MIDSPIAMFAVNPNTPGFIFLYAGIDEPEGYAFCDGREMDRAAYAPLFNLIGTSFGAGDGIGTFNLPDLRGRSPIGKGQGLTAEGGATGTSRALGAKGGTENHTLSASQMPAHTHSYTAIGTSADASLQLLGSGLRVASSSAGNTTPAGSGTAHNNMHPFQTVNFVIRL